MSFKLNILSAALLISACAFFACLPHPAFATAAAEVSSVRTVEADIRDIADPMTQNIEKRSHAPQALLAFAALILLWALYLRLSKKVAEEKEAAAPPEPKIPPHITALAELAALSGSGLLSRREFKPWYMRLSWICRVYIGASLDFNCVDSDACEIMSKLRLKKVSEQFINRFDDILSECDLVKFAKAAPSETDALAILEKCVEAVKKSRDVNFR